MLSNCIASWYLGRGGKEQRQEGMQLPAGCGDNDEADSKQERKDQEGGGCHKDAEEGLKEDCAVEKGTHRPWTVLFLCSQGDEDYFLRAGPDFDRPGRQQLNAP